MWYDEAQELLLWAGVVLGTVAGVVQIVWHPKHPKSIAFSGIAFIMGLYLGIALAARGTLLLPFAVMQHQLHEEWRLPLKGLQLPVD